MISNIIHIYSIYIYIISLTFINSHHTPQHLPNHHGFRSSTMLFPSHFQHSVRGADHPATEREPEAHVGRVEKG